MRLNLSTLVRYNETPGFQNRNQEMRLMGLQCRCGVCLCCRAWRFLQRVERARRSFDARHSRSESE